MVSISRPHAATADEALAEKRTQRGAHLAADIAVYVVLVLLAIIMLFPYLWMLSNSFKTRDYFYTHPYVIVPKVITLATYGQALTIGRVGVYLKNSAVYSTTVVVVQLIVDSLAAFAFARLRFPGRDLLFSVFLSTMMLPFSVLLIPSYLLVRAMGLANSYAGVVMPGFAGVFGIFLLRQFFLNIPGELEDAARMDGAGLLRIYARIVLPISRPALITLGVFLFIGEWSSYLWPLIILNNWDMYPITVGIALYQQMSNIEWTNVFAASTLASLPVIVLFFLAQRYIIGGISLSGLKG